MNSKVIFYFLGFILYIGMLEEIKKHQLFADFLPGVFYFS